MTKIKRERVDAQPEADLVTGLIVSSKFCKAIIPILDLSLLRGSHYKTIASWVKSYFEKHSKAPYKTIRNLYDEKEGVLEEAQASLISKFLDGLSRSYENTRFDSSYQAEKAVQYLKKRKASILIDKIKNANPDDLASILSEGKDDIAKLSQDAEKKFQPTTLEELENEDIPSMKWIVHGFIPYGLTLLWGRPKAGKSLLASNISTAIASGTKALSMGTRQGKVLHISLEDGKKETIDRFKKIRGDRNTKQNLDIIATADSFRPLLSGGVQDIRSWLEKNKNNNPRMVVIDTLERVRTVDDEATYKKDYHSLKDLQALAMEFMVSILVLHHTRKTKGSHHTEEGYGTHGLAGVADTVATVYRYSTSENDKRKEILVKITGRTIADKELSFVSTDDGGRIWNYVSTKDNKKHRRDTQKQRIIDLLEDIGEAMTPQEIAEELPGIKIGSLWQTLHLLARNNEIDKVGPKGRSGKYAYAGYLDDRQTERLTSSENEDD